MPEPFNSPPPRKHPVEELRRRLAEGLRNAWSPVAAGWRTATAPVRAALRPVTEPIGRATAPMRARWAAFRQRHRFGALALSWTGRVIRWGIYLVLFLIVSVWLGLFGKLPTSEELRNIETANASEIYTADSVLIGKFYLDENRTAVALEGVSKHVIHALIATEDRRFFDHQGIDLQSWARVAYGVVTKKESLGGGSTLSQQLAKNLYPRKKYGVPGLGIVVSKIRENFISIKLERIYTKEELLDLYLNTVPFGGDVYGINVAARQYFNKKPKDLSADQAATLIGMLKATSKYHPVRNPENALKRRNVVLQQMVKNGDLTEKEYAELSKKPVGAKYYNREGHNEGMGTYFREYLRTAVMPELLKQYFKEDGSPYNLYTDGLKIYTTLHSKMQQYAEEAVQKHMQELQKQFADHWKGSKKDKPWGDDKWITEQVKRSDRWAALKEAGLSDEEAGAAFEQPVRMTVFSWRKGGSEVDTTLTPLDSVRYYFTLLNCGFMVMDHRNGYVRAWVGGTNFKYFKYDHNLSKRQVGSTFKPIVYAAALQDSVKPCDYFRNRLVKIEDWEPHNADEKYGGWYSLPGALQKSVNVVAAQLIEKVGIQKTLDLARNMGVTAKLPREFGISLGACDISLIDMIKVYGTMANQGVRPEPVTVTRIVDRDGQVIFDHKREVARDPNLGSHVRALTLEQAATMTRMLQNVVSGGTASRLRSYVQGDFAGKTGTTQNHSDGWFICYNPQLVTGAWVGGPSPAVRFRNMALGQGSAMALPIVGWFWNKVANDKKLGRLLQEKFPAPPPEVTAEFNCSNWVGYDPYEFAEMMKDSTFRDSMQTVWRIQREEAEAAKAAAEAEKAAQEEAEKNGGEPPSLFKKLFGHNPDKKEKKEKEKEKEKDQ